MQQSRRHLVGAAALAALPSSLLAQPKLRPGNPTGSVRTATDQATRPGPAMKWHPGFYVHSNNGAWPYPVMNEYERNVLLTEKDDAGHPIAPFFRGWLVKWRWARLEKAKDRYDFGELESWLDWAHRLDKVIILRLDYTGDLSPDGKHWSCPDYMQPHFVVGSWKSRPRFRTSFPRYDHEEFCERWIALLEAVAKRFDSHPGLAAVSQNELTNPAVYSRPDYDVHQHGHNFLRVFSSAGAAFQQTPFIALMNWGFGKTKVPGTDEEWRHRLVRHAIEVAKIGTGGPDIWGTVSASEMNFGHQYGLSNPEWLGPPVRQLRYTGIEASGYYKNPPTWGNGQSAANARLDHAINVLRCGMISIQPRFPPPADAPHKFFWHHVKNRVVQLKGKTWMERPLNVV